MDASWAAFAPASAAWYKKFQLKYVSPCTNKNKFVKPQIFEIHKGSKCQIGWEIQKISRKGKLPLNDI